MNYENSLLINPVAIDTVLFEISCTTEVTAKKLQNEIINYTINSINETISNVVSEEITDNTNFKISRIEIDLGTIKLSDFGKYEMLDKLKNSLSNQLKKYKKTPINFYLSNKKDDNLKVQSLEYELELVKVFLLKGDVPWWADKSKEIRMAELIMKILNERPEAIKQFFKRNSNNYQILDRILSLYMLNNQVLINTLIPNFTKHYITKLFQNSEYTVSTNTFSVEQMMKFKSILQRRKRFSVHIRVDMLISKLLAINDFKLVYQIALFNKFSNKQLVKIGLLFDKKSSVENDVKKQIVKTIRTLSPSQIEFLYYINKPFLKGEKNYAIKKNKIETNSDSFVVSPVSTQLDITNEAFSVIEKNNLLDQDRQRDDVIKADTELDITDEAFSVIEKNNLLDQDRQRDDGTKADTDNDHQSNLNADAIKQNNNEIIINRINENDEDTFNSLKEEIHPDNKEFENSSVEDFEKNKIHDSFNQSTKFDVTGIVKTPEKDDDISSGFANELQQDAYMDTGTSFASLFFKEAFLNSEDIKNVFEGKHSDKRSIQIKQLLKNLQSENINLFYGLMQLPNEELLKLTKFFSKQKSKKFKRRKVINNIVTHSYFFKYNLLKIIGGLSFGKIVLPKIELKESVENVSPRNAIEVQDFFIKEIKKSQDLFLSSLKKLSEKEVVILKDVLEKGNYSTKNEKKAITDFLYKLPEENIALLSFLSDLPEKELQQLLAITSKFDSTNVLVEADESFDDYSKNTQRKVYIENGGLCLIALYFVGLFNNLKYLEKSTFKDKFTAARALHVIQYIANVKYTNSEHLMQFNKTLCGFEIDESIPGSIRLTKKEIVEADVLLKSVIENWKALKNISIQGFRESFLQRKAIIFENDTYWTLQVERKSYDILLGTIPWSYTMIKFPWMKKMIKVEW